MRAGHAVAGGLCAVLAATAGTGAWPAAATPSHGIISTLAGGAGRGLARNVAQTPLALAAAPDGTVYVGDQSGIVRALSSTSTWERAIAGGGSTGPEGPADRTSLGFIGGTAVDAGGNVVISDTGDSQVLVLASVSGRFYGQAMTAGHVYGIAGTGHRGYSGDGGPATAAEVDEPRGAAVDAAGNVVFADNNNDVIRVVAAATGTFYGIAMTAGDIYTIAGTGNPGFSGDGGPATAATLDFPYGLALDTAGNVLVADTNNSRIRVVAAATGTFYGIAMTAGDIYTIAGSSTEGYGGDGGPATAAKLAFPAGVSVDAAGSAVIADTASSRIRVVAAATGTFYGIAMTAGDIYTIAGDGTRGYSGDGGPATAAKIREPQDVAVDRSGNLVIADTANNRIRVVAESTGTFYGHPMTAGDIYTEAGTGLLLSGNRGKAANAEAALPFNIEVSLPGPESAATGIAADAAGDVAFYDNGEVRVVPAASGTLFGQPVTGGNVYAVAGDGHLGYSGDGAPATAATVQAAGGLAFDHDGNLVIADTGNHVVRVVAAATGTFYGRAMTAGDIYTVAGDGGNGYSGNTGPATLAELSDPAAVAVDAAGNLLIADTNINIRSLPGRIRVVAASPGTFYGQAMTAGHIYSVAGSDARHTTGSGGPATTAYIGYPLGLAVDPSGNMIIAGADVNSIWVVAARTGTFFGQPMTAGDIYQVAAAGALGLAADRHGNVLIAGGGPVRALAAESGTFYGVHMTTGGLFTVAGSSNSGYSGDGGPAVDALLSNPEAVAVAPDGDLLIMDDGNRRVREVTP